MLMNNEFIDLNHLFDSPCKIVSSKKNSPTSTINRTTNEHKFKRTLESSEIKRVQKTIDTTRQINILDTDLFYLEKFDFMLLKIHDIVEDFENFFIDVEFERIEKEQILKKKFIRLFNVMKMIEKSSYQLNIEIKSNLYNRSVSPKKEKNNKLALSADFFFIKDTGEFKLRTSNQFYVKYLKVMKLLNTVELTIIRRVYERMSNKIITPAKVTFIKKLGKFLRFEKYTDRILELLDEKNSLRDKINKKESDKFPLVNHFEELFSLEKQFHERKNELQMKIDKYKFILELNSGTNL